MRKIDNVAAKSPGHGLSVPAFLLMCFVVPGATAAFAQSYPVKPVRVIVSSAPGGGTDFVARTLDDPVSRDLGQSVVVDNRGGAGGVVGADLAAKSAPDGYTLLMTFINFTIYPSLHQKLPFDPVKDFLPVTTLATTPLVMVVNPQVPAQTVGELIALAKGGNARLNYAAPGVGSLGHLAGELFKGMTGTSMVHVPYKGGGPAITALLGGEVQLYFSTMPAALTQVKAGRLRALAVTGAKRAAAAPNVPTIAESGVAGYDVTGWFGLLAPAGTPSATVARINRAFVSVLAMPQVRERFAVEGLEPGGATPAEFGAIIKADIAKWSKVIKQAGIKSE